MTGKSLVQYVMASVSNTSKNLIFNYMNSNKWATESNYKLQQGSVIGAEVPVLNYKHIILNYYYYYFA